MLNDRNEENRTGLRVVTRKGVHDDVRQAVLKFATWLRRHYDFPMRLTVYLFAEERISSSSGEYGVSLFFEPAKKTGDSVIYAASGDYEELIRKRGNRDDALCEIVCEIANHVVSYQNWVFNHNWSKATVRRRWKALMYAYATDVKHII